MAQTRAQQQEAAEKASQSPEDWQKTLEKRKKERDEVIESVKKEEKKHEMDSFYSYVTLIRSKIQSIDDGKKDIWKISSQSMVSVSDEQVAELSARLELISSRTNKNAEEIRGFLKDLSAENEALNKKYRSDNSSACMRIRLVQADALIRKFTNSIGAFESTENSIQSKSRELLVRRFQIVQPEIETDELIKSLGDGNDLGTINNVFAFAASTGGSSQELEKKLEHFRAQQRSMHRLERNILNLNKMFLDMQNLVLAQEENLDHIEVYTQHTVQYQKATNVEKALEYQKNIRKKATEAAQLNQKAAAGATGIAPISGPPKGGNPLFQPFQKSSTMEKGESINQNNSNNNNNNNNYPNDNNTSSEIPPVITDEDEKMEMPRFFAQINEIKDTNKRVEKFTDEIGKLHKEALSTVDSQISADVSSKIEALMAKVTQMSNRTRRTLQEMDQVNKQLSQSFPKGSGNLRMRESNFRQLSSSFVDIMRKYQKMQEHYQEKYRAQLQRQYLIVKPRATTAELAEMTRDPEAMKVQVFALSVKDDSKKTLGQMKNRLQDMQNIERSVVELQQMFLQMQDLVVSQGAIINHIGYNVDQIEDYTAQAAKSMDVALESEKAIQKKKWYIVMIVGAIVGVLIIFALVIGIINFLPMLMTVSLLRR